MHHGVSRNLPPIRQLAADIPLKAGLQVFAHLEQIVSAAELVASVVAGYSLSRGLQSLCLGSR